MWRSDCLDVSNGAIFSDDKRYWNIFEPICQEMDRRGLDVVYMTASEDDPALDQSYAHLKAEFIGKDNKAFAKLNFLTHLFRQNL